MNSVTLTSFQTELGHSLAVAAAVLLSILVVGACVVLVMRAILSVIQGISTVVATRRESTIRALRRENRYLREIVANINEIKQNRVTVGHPVGPREVIWENTRRDGPELVRAVNGLAERIYKLETFLNDSQS